MSQTTTNLQLVKPELTDNITPTIFAENFEKIDAAVGEINSNLDGKVDSLSGEYSDTESTTYTALSVDGVGYDQANNQLLLKVGGADSVIPFSKGSTGRLIDLGTATVFDIKTLLPDVDYTKLTVDDFVILLNVSNSSTSASVYDYPDSGSLSASSCSYTRHVAYNASTGVLNAYSQLYITTHTHHNSTSSNSATVSAKVYYKENIEVN